MLCKGCSETVVEGTICKNCGTDNSVEQEKAETPKAEKKSSKK